MKYMKQRCVIRASVSLVFSLALILGMTGNIQATVDEKDEIIEVNPSATEDDSQSISIAGFGVYTGINHWGLGFASFVSSENFWLID